MKRIFLLVSSAILVFGSCATRSTQVQFANDIRAEDKQAAKLAFFYLDDDETITYLTYDVAKYNADNARYKKGDFLAFNGRLHEGPKWVALKPGIAYIGIFKPGYNPGTLMQLLRGGTYYRLVESNRALKVAFDDSPNLTAEVLKAQGIQ